MTLEEFQRRLIAQKNAQSQSLLNPNLKLDNYTNDTKKNNYDNNLENKVISNNPNTKEVLKAPISQSVNRKLNIDPSALKNNNTIFDDIGNNIKNYKIGVKQGGLNFVNTFGKWGNAISNYVFNREEKTEKSIDEDLKMYGIDGTGLTLQEKVNKLIETDPLSMDKYSRVLQSNGIEYRGNDILSNIGNAVSMLQANNGNIFTAPYDEIINGVSLTEDEEGNVITDTPFSKRDVNVIDNKIKELEEEANKNTEQVDNSLLKYTAGLMPSLGSNTVSLVADTLAPGTGSVYFTASAANSYALDGKEKGLSDDASLLYGATLGYLDGQLEKIGLNNLTKAGKNMVKGATKEAIKSYATSMLDNYIQEALMEPAQEAVNQIFTGESDWKGMPSRMNQAGIAGAVSSAILGGVSAGVSKGVNIATNTNQQNKLKTQITEKINNNTMLEKDVKTQMLNSLDKLNVNSLTNLNHELDTIDEVITQINKSDITNVIESRRNSLNNNQNSKAYLFSQYKNSKLDNNVVNSAMEIVPSNKQNKRTKEQWLKVAEQIGNNINSEDAEMYAYKTWMDMRPNNKNNLNRQGKSYVSFTVDEWVNKVKEASNNNVTNNQEQIKSVNEVLPKNIENVLFDDEFYKRFEYEDRSKINDTIENLESKREELLKNTKNNEFNDELFNINAKINALKNGYDNLYDYYVGRAKNDIIEEYNRNPAKYERIINQKQQQLDNEQKLNVEIQETTPQKRQQYEIIKQTNPMLDDYHTGIRSPEDIKTFNEVINDEDSFVWGDFSKEDAQQALKQGKVTVYSSYPIEQGVFVSTSKIQAQEYAGGNGNKVYSKEVPLEDVAWINGDEGQYAKLANDNKASEETQLKNDIDNFSKQVDSVINGTFPKNDMLTLLSNTPKILQDIGLKNYPITMTQKHLDTIMNAEGKHKNANYHNLGEEIVKQLPEAIANPLDIVQSNTNKNSIVLTTYLADKNNNTIIASIKIDGKGTVNDVRIDTNVMTSAYGKDNYDRFMQKNIKQGNLLYDIDQGTIKKLSGLGSNYLDDSTYINNIIPSEQNYVNNNENSIKNKENVPDSPEFKEKQRKRYQTIINSEVVSKEAKAIAKELMGVDTYIPESNVQQLNRADYTIEKLGVERALEGLKNKIDGGQRVLAEDIAIGDRLIQYYSKTGQKKELQDAIQYTAMAGTEAGRTVQAMAMIAHQSPEGQVLWIQRSINKLNQKIASKKGGKVEVIDGKQVVTKNGKVLEKVQLFEFTSDMQKSILSAKSNEEMYDILDHIYEELGGQVTKNTFEKLDSWRYFSMLANPTTHMRNIVGNTAMSGIQGIKNKMAGGIEDIVAIFNKDMERTKSLVRIADAETVKFAKDDIKNVADRLGLNQNKYSPRSRIESNKREFKSNLLNETLGKAYKSNSRLLEVEDGWGLKYNYARALSSYIASNNIDINNITDAQLGKARNYAIAQAKEATFHQESRLASALNQIGNNNEIAKFVLDSTVPFKAVPINVAKTGLAYSPLQLVKSTTVDLVNLRNRNINLNQYIDNLSKGLTGTGIALIGYMLAQMGILKANGSDEDKEKYDEAQGKQTFSVTIGTQNFSLSWLAPTAIPLFIGAEISEILDSDKENKNNLNDKDYDKALNIAKDSIDVFANAMNPMTEMSMLSGLTSVFRSYDQDNYLVGIGTNIVKSYANQYVPTALGKIARITDEYERDTTSTKSDTVSKAIDSTKNQIMSKIPVFRQMLPVKKDTWGREIKSPTLPIRIFENTLAPYTRKEISNDKVDKYLNNLYDKTKDKDLLPDTISKTLIFDGSTYRYTNEEYNKYKAEFGKSAYDKITKVMNNKAFNKLANEEKVDIIDKIYSDCKEEVKEKYAKVHKIEYERSDKDIEVEEEIKKGLDISNSYIYKTIISKKESDKDEDGNTISNSATKNKLKYIMSMEIDDKQKQHLINISINDTDYDVSVNDLNKLKGDYLTYLQQSGKTPENGGMTAREKYIKLVDANIPVEQLNKYYNEIGDVEGTKDENGKTISGSKKQAVFNYINSLSLNIPQKQILLAREYDSFAKEYYWDIVNYINSLNMTKEEKSSIFNSIYN